MIIFSLIVFFNVKVSLFFVFFLTPLCLISGFWWLICSLLFFISFSYLFFFPFFVWVIFLVVIWFLMVLFFLVCESVFLWFWPESLFFVWDTFLGFSFLLSLFLTILLYCTFTRIGLLSFYIFESRLIPTLFFILGWGYQSERVQAGIYLFAPKHVGTVLMSILM